MAGNMGHKARWNRSRYPLQSPNHGSEQRHIPASSVKEPQHAETTQDVDRHYPRQRTMQSIGDVLASTDQSAAPTSSPGQDIPMNSQSSSQAAKGRRRGYPLQSPASRAVLRPPTPTESSHDGENLSDDQESQNGQQPQSAGFPANLHHPPSPPPSEDETKVVQKTKRKTLRRQAYPLQAQASVANLNGLPSEPDSPVSANTNYSEQPVSSERNTALAANAVQHWQRQAYPLQMPVTSPPSDDTPPPYAHDHETNHSHEEPIHLPKNIRATTDDEKRDSAGRTIVVCLDGTGDKFDNDNSNIVHIVSALKKDDPNQVSYYQAGIGTYGEGGLSGGLSAAMDMAVGSSLGTHVREAYSFLMHSYKEGDKICIFGFSRGAYTARCLAGMVHKVGLLPPRNHQQIPFAYEFYANNSTAGWKQSEDFKRTFSIDVCVYFLGCFDSVASVGFIPRQLPLSSTPSSKPRYFRHAMALDERRAKFKICRHQDKDWEDIKKDLAQEKSGNLNLTEEEYKDLMANEAPFDTDVSEVWFAGAHADVGGGAVPNKERHKLAQIPLRWMIRQSFECNTGIIFKTRVLCEYGLDIHKLWPVYRPPEIPLRSPPTSLLDRYDQGLPPRSTRGGKLVPIDKHEKGEQLLHFKSHTDEDWTPEHIEDFFDAVTPIYDQLVETPNWWLLEFLPVEWKEPLAPGKVAVRTGMNLGRYRGVEDVEPSVHWTVAHRTLHLGYKIQARTAPNTRWRSVA